MKELEKKSKESFNNKLQKDVCYCTYNEEKKIYKDGYIAGAKENGVVWHDLRKNPNDLPKEFKIIKKAFGIYPEEKYIHTVLNQDGEHVHYIYGDWYYIYNEDIVGDSPRANVIAWCEIPKYTEE